MSCFTSDLVKLLISQKFYPVITEFAHIEFPDKKENIIVNEYDGSCVRMFKSGDNINILCPQEMTTVQEGHVVDAIAKGTVFDDMETVENNSKYIELRSLPYTGMINKGHTPPKKLHVVISCIIGKMDDEGRFNVDDTDITNGHNFVKDVIHHDEKNRDVNDIVDDYIGNKEHESLPITLRRDIANIQDEIDSINDVSNEDVITDEDFDFVDTGDDKLSSEKIDDESYQEGFLSKKPKKLKPIPRDIIAYITVEMNAIEDSNDQAMLSGYTCSKLELVDFYLNVIDTKDDRYIVPHTRDYLVNMQNELNKLLTQILRIRPINRNDRVWRVNVNYPEGWRG